MKRSSLKLALAALLAAITFTIQFPVPALRAADSATNDLIDYLSRAGALKAEDIPGHLALARWARDRQLWAQAADQARAVLDKDPDNRPAWDILKKSDDSVPLRTEPEVEDALKKEFQKRYDRSFSTRNSRHFILCYDTTDQFAVARAAALEKAYDAFMFSFSMQTLRPQFLEKRLVVILFKSRADYLDYAQKTEGADLSWASGFYSQRTNRSAFYDDSTGPSAVDAEKQMDDARKRLSQIQTQIAIARQRNDLAAVNRHTAERNALSDAIARNDLRIGNVVGMFNTVKTAHEAAHQLAFNTGIQKRLVDYPLWFSEGLACSFETEDRNNVRGPLILNPGRMNAMKDALKSHTNIPLEQFITAPIPDQKNTAQLGVFYAQGWTLFHFLYKTNRAGMEKYLLAYNHLDPLRELSPEDRLKLFTDAFSDDLPALEKKFLTYIKETPPRTP